MGSEKLLPSHAWQAEHPIHAPTCFAEGFIGIDDDLQRDLQPYLTDDWRQLNAKLVPIFLELYPTKSRIAAGLACGVMWTVCRGILKGDIVLCPDGRGTYRVGEVTGDYTYATGEVLPHRRAVHWLDAAIEHASMSEALKRSTGSIGTVANITSYHDELEGFIGGKPAPKLISTDETVEDAAAFALEKHLEDFLVQNWVQTALGKEYDIYEEDGEKIGQQYPTDTGPMDILAKERAIGRRVEERAGQRCRCWADLALYGLRCSGAGRTEPEGARRHYRARR